MSLIMIIGSWNCRGAGSQAFPIMIHDIVKKFKVDILCLLEPRISGTRADKVIRKLGFSNWIRVEACGFAGGIWLLWDVSLFDITYVSSNSQILHVLVYDKSNRDKTELSVVYGEPRANNRGALWDSIRLLASCTKEPWLVVGDFNSILSTRDKLGSVNFDAITARSFRDCLDDAGLVETPVRGEWYTWEREGLKERIDWVFHNNLWESAHPNMVSYHNIKFKSDHKLVVVNSNDQHLPPPKGQ